MENIEINDYFKRAYLTCGQTRDNFVFEKCPIAFMDKAEHFLAQMVDNIKPCNIRIGSKEQQEIEDVFAACSNDYQKKVLAIYYVTTLIMSEFFKGIDEGVYKSLIEQLREFEYNNFENIKENCIDGFMPFDIAKSSKKMRQKIEVNIFLSNMDNVYLQQAINNFIGSREPYSIKLFSNSILATYYDQNGNLIQSPHDYMSRNIFDFVSFENDEEKEI